MSYAATFETGYQFYHRNLHEQTVRVLLYGHLRKKFGKLHLLAVKTPQEAIKALNQKFPGFFKAIRFYKPGFAVFIGENNIDKVELTMNCGGEDIKIIPIIAGSGNQNWMTVIVGAILIVIGVVVGVYAGWTGVGGQISAGLISAGAAMIVGGVAQMLFAPSLPDAPQESDGHKPSYLFNGPVNTYAQGHCVPVLLGGPLRTGSAVISASLLAEEWNQGGYSDPNDASTGGGGIDGGGGRHIYHLSND